MLGKDVSMEERGGWIDGRKGWRVMLRNDGWKKGIDGWMHGCKDGRKEGRKG